MSQTMSASPTVVLLGIRDGSKRVQSPSLEVRPSFLPKTYLYAETGSTAAQYVDGSYASLIYGTDTFDLRKKYANHATRIVNTVFSAAGASIIERVIPKDVGPKPNVLLSLDLLETDIPQYVRGPDGNILMDNTNNPTPTGTTVRGYIGKWVLTGKKRAPSDQTDYTTTTDSTLFGISANVAGDQTDGVNTSIRFPILEFWSDFFTEATAGIRLYAPISTGDDPLNTKLMKAIGSYPFRISMVQRIKTMQAGSIRTTSRMIPTLQGGNYVECVLKPNQINPYTDAECSITEQFLGGWKAIGSPGYLDVIPPIGQIHVYQENADYVLGLLSAAEINAVKANALYAHMSDFSDPTTDSYIFNLVSGQNGNGTKYLSYQLNNQAANASTLSQNIDLMTFGGELGTMSNANFAALVEEKVAQYLDPDSPVQDMALNTESCFIDGGFPFETKKKLAALISQRKDIFLYWSTFDPDYYKFLTPDGESAIAAALKAAGDLMPESTFYGTEACRYLIMGRFGPLAGASHSREQFPVVLELTKMLTRVMGAGDGMWKMDEMPDSSPKNELTMFTKLNVESVSTTQRQRDWENGLNYPVHNTRRIMHFDSLKTGYSDDTSILTSPFMGQAACDIQKIAAQAFRNVMGSVKLTQAQVCERVRAEIDTVCNGKFGTVVKVVPNIYTTPADTLRGYSITGEVAMYGNNQVTRMQLSIPALRASDLTGATTK